MEALVSKKCQKLKKNCSTEIFAHRLIPGFLIDQNQLQHCDQNPLYPNGSFRLRIIAYLKKYGTYKGEK